MDEKPGPPIKTSGASFFPKRPTSQLQEKAGFLSSITFFVLFNIVAVVALFRLWKTPYSIFWWSILILFVLDWLTGETVKTATAEKSGQSVVRFWIWANMFICPPFSRAANASLNQPLIKIARHQKVLERIMQCSGHREPPILIIWDVCLDSKGCKPFQFFCHSCDQPWPAITKL